MSRHMLSSVITAIIILASFAPAALQGAEKGDALLEMIPADAIFCARINNLNQTTGVIDQYLMGIVPVTTGGMLKGQLGMMFGNFELKGFDLNGTFAVFATAESGGQVPDIYFLLPVTDYSQVIDPNFRVSKPDSNGISTVGTGPRGQFFIKNIGSFALMSKDHDKLGDVAGTMSSGNAAGLIKSLDSAQLSQAASQPIWAYANFVKISEVYKTQITEGIDEIKKQAANPGAGIQKQIDNLEKMKIQMTANDSKIQSRIQEINLKIERLKEQRTRIQNDINQTKEEMKQVSDNKKTYTQKEKILQERKTVLASVDEQINKLEQLYNEPEPNHNPAVAQIDAQIESLKMRKQQAQKTPAGMGRMMDVFGTLLKDFMQQTKSVTLVCNPKPDVLNFRAGVNALPGTEMAEMLVAEEHPAKNDFAGFAEEGAAMNFVGWIDHASMKKMYAKCIDFMAQAAGKDPGSADNLKIKKLCDEMIDSIGDRFVCTVSIDPNTKPPFDAAYVLAVKDVEQFNRTTDEFAQTWTGSAFDELYKGLGMETGFTIKRGVDNYKGIPIDSATLTMKFADANLPEAQMINAMYGQGFNYRWAMVDGLWVCRISNDPNAIYKLIDRAKAGPPTQICPEMQKAMAVIPDADKADVIFTYNYLRLLKMMSAMMPMQIPQMNISSKSNLVFAARAEKGKLIFDAALPKEHLQEMMMVFQMMMQMQMQRQQQQMQQMEQETVPSKTQ